MSHPDQIRPTKRVKHVHTASGRSKLANGVDALLEPNLRPNNGKRLKANLSSDKAKTSRIAQLDESRTIVQANGDVEMQDRPGGVVEISSDSPSSSIDNFEEEEEKDDEEELVDGTGNDDNINGRRGKRRKSNVTRLNGTSKKPHSLKSIRRSENPKENDIVEGKEDEKEVQRNRQIAEQNANDDFGNVGNEEPSFGELLQAQAPTEPIDVTSAFDDRENNNQNSFTNHKGNIAPTASPTRKFYTGPITANSLGTVLTQALRTNDNDLLESCLGLTDYAGVRATIERLPSHLATTLLLRLAERLHRRPGRAGNLMVWVQWSLVAHGGYLASQPAAVAQLSVLRRVVRERADGLQPLLRLKGKLDMLAAQLELRKKMKRRGLSGSAGIDDEDEEENDDNDDEGIIYVEGAEEDDDDEDEDEDEKEPADDIMIIDGDEDDEHARVESKQRKKRKKRSPKDLPASPSTTKQNKINMNNYINNREEQHSNNHYEEGSSSSEIDAMPTTTATASLVNGIHSSSNAGDEENDEDVDEDDENLIDDEAEETDRDTGDDEDDLSEGSDLDGFIDDGEDIEEDEEEEDDEDDGDEIEEVEDEEAIL